VWRMLLRYPKSHCPVRIPVPKWGNPDSPLLSPPVPCISLFWWGLGTGELGAVGPDGGLGLFCFM